MRSGANTSPISSTTTITTTIATCRPKSGRKLNYDHPDSLDTQFMVEQLQQLRNNQAIAMPMYNFATHSRLADTQRVEPAKIILVEGILIFAERSLRKLMDMRIFVDTDADLRFIRRLKRDMDERGRSLDSVVNQYLATVRPMHMEFVEPTKRYADIIVPAGGHNRVAMEMIVSRIHTLLEPTSRQGLRSLSRQPPMSTRPLAPGHHRRRPGRPPERGAEPLRHAPGRRTPVARAAAAGGSARSSTTPTAVIPCRLRCADVPATPIRSRPVLRWRLGVLASQLLGRTPAYAAPPHP